jgi:hypothetical protein
MDDPSGSESSSWMFLALARKKPVGCTIAFPESAMGAAAKGLRVRIEGEENLRNLVDHGVGALGREDDGDEELEMGCQRPRRKAYPGNAPAGAGWLGCDSRKGFMTMNIPRTHPS